jgi:hypothetical protein
MVKLSRWSSCITRGRLYDDDERMNDRHREVKFRGHAHVKVPILRATHLQRRNPLRCVAPRLGTSHLFMCVNERGLRWSTRYKTGSEVSSMRGPQALTET